MNGFYGKILVIDLCRKHFDVVPVADAVLADSGKNITEEELDRMLQDYYRLRGWDAAGVPPEDAV